jgi:RNA polymerase subunit RPABC4/transcription elongation factor Spt4
MLYDLWDLYQQGQINSATETAEIAKRDGAHTADRLHREVLRLESKIDRLALIAQAQWELIRQKTGLSDKDIEARMAEIDVRDGRKDGRITGTPTTCPKCARPANTRNRVCPYCGTPIDKGHIVEKS